MKPLVILIYGRILEEMDFKSPEMEAQFEALPPKLKEMVHFFEYLCEVLGKQCVVTRCWDPVPGDSGVHEAHRGVDCRDQTEEGRLFQDSECDRITQCMNAFYPRTDGHASALHHSFQGAPFHFHFQIPLAWV